MFDKVVILDETLRCPHGHLVGGGFQTKSFSNPSMDTYLVEGPHVYRVARTMLGGSDEIAAQHWRLEANEALFQHRHSVEPIVPPRNILFDTSCDACAPVLIRGDHARICGDLIDERQFWVEFRATFDPDGGGASNGRRRRPCDRASRAGAPGHGR